MADRSQLISRAVNFLLSPRVQAAPLADRIAFLQGKGFTEKEIQEVMRKAEKILKERQASSTSMTESTTASTVTANKVTRALPVADYKASESVVAGGLCFVSLACNRAEQGGVGGDDDNIKAEMKGLLDRIDKALEAGGTSKARLVSLLVCVKGVGERAGVVNEVLDAWVDPQELPTRTLAEGPVLLQVYAVAQT